MDEEENVERDDEFTDVYRAAFLEGYEQGITDGRNQGREAAYFLIKSVLADVYDDDVRKLVEKLEKEWE